MVAPVSTRKRTGIPLTVVGQDCLFKRLGQRQFAAKLARLVESILTSQSESALLSSDQGCASPSSTVIIDRTLSCCRGWCPHSSPRLVRAAGSTRDGLPGRRRPDLDTACELLGGVDCAKRKKLRAPVTAEAGHYLRRTKQEIATPPLYRTKTQLAKLSAAARRPFVEVKKFAPGLADVWASAAPQP
jgi:hypothetical protein